MNPKKTAMWYRPMSHSCGRMARPGRSVNCPGHGLPLHRGTDPMKSSPFAKLPVWMLALKPPPHAVVVYAVLYLYSDWETGTVCISHSDVADVSGMSRAQVKRMVLWLREHEVLSWEEQHDGPTQLPNLYTLVVDKGGVLSDPGVCESYGGVLSELHTISTDRSIIRRVSRKQPVENWPGGTDVYASHSEIGLLA